MTVVDRFVQAVSHGGVMNHPTLIVVHSAETPLKAGYAKSIAENWFGKSATTSAHFMLDPVECIRLLSDNVVSYAVGPKANGFTLNIEQAGYASLSRVQWTTADGMKQLAKVGALIGELSAAHQIPLRWATDAQIRAAASGTPGGVCFHDDIHRVLGGTTHTDPTPHYPGDLLQQAWSNAQEADDMYDQAARDEVIGRIDQGFAQMTNFFNALDIADTRTRIGIIQYGMNLLLSRSEGESIDYDKLAAALAPVLAPMVAEAGTGASPEQVADLLAQRLAA